MPLLTKYAVENLPQRDSRRRRNHHENFCRGCHCNVHAAAFPVSANQRKIRVAEEKRIARNDGDVLASGGCGEEKLKRRRKKKTPAATKN